MGAEITDAEIRANAEDLYGEGCEEGAYVRFADGARWMQARLADGPRARRPLPGEREIALTPEAADSIARLEEHPIDPPREYASVRFGTDPKFTPGDVPFARAAADRYLALPWAERVGDADFSSGELTLLAFADGSVRVVATGEAVPDGVRMRVVLGFPNTSSRDALALALIEGAP